MVLSDAEGVLDLVADRVAALLARRAVPAVLFLVHVALAAALCERGQLCCCSIFGEGFGGVGGAPCHALPRIVRARVAREVLAGGVSWRSGEVDRGEERKKERQEGRRQLTPVWKFA